MKTIIVTSSGRTAKVKPSNHKRTFMIQFPAHFGLGPVKVTSVVVKPETRPLRKQFVLDTEMTERPPFNIPAITPQEVRDIIDVFTQALVQSQPPKMIVFDSLSNH